MIHPPAAGRQSANNLLLKVCGPRAGEAPRTSAVTWRLPPSPAAPGFAPGCRAGTGTCSVGRPDLRSAAAV